MLDYEIIKYIVKYLRFTSCSESTASFYTEEEAIEFIKENRNKWKNYRLIKIESAIIDF